MKKKGWYKESKRHSLASYGIKTHNKKYDKLPIYITDKPVLTKDNRMLPMDFYSLTHDNSDLAPIAKMQMFRTLEKHPKLEQDIERAEPKAILYSSKAPPEKDESSYADAWVTDGLEVVLRPPKANMTEERYKKLLKEAKEWMSKEEYEHYKDFKGPFKGDSKEEKLEKIADHNAKYLRHELSHLDDVRSGKSPEYHKFKPYSDEHAETYFGDKEERKAWRKSK